MIASRSRAAYLMHMAATRFAAILAMLALLFAPLGMIGGYAAMAQPAASASHHEQSPDQAAHCVEMSGETQDGSDGSPLLDCLTDCAITCSAIPALGNAIADPLLMPRIAHSLALVSPLGGLPPEAADPPPRIS
jgi:hypothetical protein